MWWFTDMATDYWQRVSLFESFDYVRSWYRREHGKTVNSEKTRQVNAFFTQGREYFRNASLANLSVKPLLLYYGVLSLSRGAILLKDETKKEESLVKRHGLDTVGWESSLSTGIQGILDLRIKSTHGTFRELASCCANKHQEHCFTAPTLGRRVVDHFLGDMQFVDGASTFSLDELLSRLIPNPPKG